MRLADVSFYQYRCTDSRLSAISRYIDFFKMQTISPPFPQYRDNVILPVFAMAGSNENYIPKYRVRILSDQEPTPNPYVPVRLNPYGGNL